ncbi:hypothetical protein STPH2_7402 [Streptomyces sp. KO7888]|nr:hypothetical protein [Streptomyces sp. KO7888]
MNRSSLPFGIDPPTERIGSISSAILIALVTSPDSYSYSYSYSCPATLDHRTTT